MFDYYREPKSFVSDLAAINGPITVVARPEAHVAWAGETVDTTLTVVNDTPNALSGTLRWSIASRGDEAAGTESASAAPSTYPTEESVTVPASGTTTLERAVQLPNASQIGEADQLLLSTSFQPDSAPDSVSTAEPITLVDADRDPSPSTTVYAEGTFASRLAEMGTNVTHTLSDTVDIAVTTEITNRIDNFANEGGAVIHTPDRYGEMRAGGPFTYRPLPQTESWDITAGFYYQDSPLLEGICPERQLGWEFESLYPYDVATDLNPSVDRVHVGYVEGWLANWASPFVIRGYGSGSMTALTFRATHQYGRHPVATLLCDRLIDWLSRRG